MGLFKNFNKVIEVIYRLNLLLKIKIYLIYYITILKLVYGNYKLLIYYITILKLVYGNYKLLIYKQDMYKGYKEDK